MSGTPDYVARVLEAATASTQEQVREHARDALQDATWAAESLLSQRSYHGYTRRDLSILHIVVSMREIAEFAHALSAAEQRIAADALRLLADEIVRTASIFDGAL